MNGNRRAFASAIDMKIAEPQLYGLLFAAAVTAFCLSKLIGHQLGITSQVVATLGDATCGWSWLLVRALFRRAGPKMQWWPLGVVIAMVMVGGVLRFGSGYPGPLLRVADNIEGLASSALLLLAAIEPLRGIGENIPRSEKRFRVGFAVAYGVTLAVSVLLIDGAPGGSAAAKFGGIVKALCALVALAGMGAAIWYRAGHPVPEPARIRRRVASDADDGLRDRILQIIQIETVFAQPDLKVADLARRVGEAEYKVTQCITGSLGFRNFNHMANHYRIAEAKRRFSAPSLDHLPILTVALDCGFGSIGPFNRAFKEETGMTPMQFRKSRHPDSAVG